MLAVQTLQCEGTRVSVLPGRGAFVARLTVDGVEVLYLDEATLDSPTGAIRGGIPLLFPFAGELEGGRLIAAGTAMPRHGFGRRRAWNVTRHTAESIEMRLAADADTRAQYPFEFSARIVVTALARGVRIDLHVDNQGTAPMPLAPGWHPYFPCPADQKRACLSQVIPAKHLASDPVACDVNIPAAPDRRLTFALPAIGDVALAFSEQLRTLEVWTPPEQPLVCVEPWVGPSNTINTPDAVTLAPGTTMHFWMRIERSPKNQNVKE